MATLTQSRLKQIVHYDPDSGDFTWIESRGSITANSKAGHLSSYGYIKFRIDRREYFAHRLAFLYMTGSIPDVVDHINGARADNKWSNLRPATIRQNNRNCKTKHCNSSGVKGVRWAKGKSKWEARIRFGGKQRTIGYYPDLISAELAVMKKRNELHGEFARHH